MSPSFIFFFFNDTATTEIYTLSLHDALPILQFHGDGDGQSVAANHLSGESQRQRGAGRVQDRKSTRLNSSHLVISYAVFCLKKKKNQPTHFCSRANSAIKTHTRAHSPTCRSS